MPKLVMPDREARRALFDSIDVNGNGGLSLAEIDKAVISGLLGKADGIPVRFLCEVAKRRISRCFVCVMRSRPQAKHCTVRTLITSLH